jgi:hypothetical protein
VDAILGTHNTDEAFQHYLDHWRTIMDARIAQCRDAFHEVNGLEALVLAGSNGTGAAWPLSDIDLIPIYAAPMAKTAAEDVERVRVDLLRQWSSGGWRTGVDVGKLAFTSDEVRAALELDDPASNLGDERWYHSIDKGYRGRPLIEAHHAGQSLASWFTKWRFQPVVVEHRLLHSRQQAWGNLQSGLVERTTDRIRSYRHLLKSIQWTQIHLMEIWGQRDNSLGRFGTRFEHAASDHNMVSWAVAFKELAGLTAAEVTFRLDLSPPWVIERLDRSWRARLSTGEVVSQEQNQADVLRVSTDYELREVGEPPYAAWLAIPSSDDLAIRFNRLQSLLGLLT